MNPPINGKSHIPSADTVETVLYSQLPIYIITVPHDIPSVNAITQCKMGRIRSISPIISHFLPFSVDVAINLSAIPESWEIGSSPLDLGSTFKFLHSVLFCSICKKHHPAIPAKKRTKKSGMPLIDCPQRSHIIRKPESKETCTPFTIPDAFMHL